MGTQKGRERVHWFAFDLILNALTFFCVMDGKYYTSLRGANLEFRAGHFSTEDGIYTEEKLYCTFYTIFLKNKLAVESFFFLSISLACLRLTSSFPNFCMFRSPSP